MTQFSAERLVADPAISGTFFDVQREKLARVFDILNVPTDASASLEAAVAATQPWIKGDHVRPEYDFSINTEQSLELRGLYDRLGLSGEHELPAGLYDHILVLGGTHIGNNRRLEFLSKAFDEKEVTVLDSITLLGGQRFIYPEVESSLIEQNRQQLKGEKSVDTWFRGLEAGRSAIVWETDLLRLAALAKLGALTLKKIEFRLENSDPLRALNFDWQGINLRILHTLAVARPNGEPRHTTEACLEDWIYETQPKEGANVAFVAANPHIERVGKTAGAILRKLGREDVQIVMAGPGAQDSYGHPIFLGEIARNLWEDKKLVETR